jgi:hypothetical protein
MVDSDNAKNAIATSKHVRMNASFVLQVLPSSASLPGEDCAVALERAADPLHGAWINTKPGSDLPHTLSASRLIQRFPNALLQLRRYSGPAKLFPLTSGACARLIAGDLDRYGRLSRHCVSAASYLNILAPAITTSVTNGSAEQKRTKSIASLVIASDPPRLPDGSNDRESIPIRNGWPARFRWMAVERCVSRPVLRLPLAVTLRAPQLLGIKV